MYQDMPTDSMQVSMSLPNLKRFHFIDYFLCAEKISHSVHMPMSVPVWGHSEREREREKPCLLTCRCLLGGCLMLKVNSSFHVGSFVLPLINFT